MEISQLQKLSHSENIALHLHDRKEVWANISGCVTPPQHVIKTGSKNSNSGHAYILVTQTSIFSFSWWYQQIFF